MGTAPSAELGRPGLLGWTRLRAGQAPPSSSARTHIRSRPVFFVFVFASSSSSSSELSKIRSSKSRALKVGFEEVEVAREDVAHRGVVAAAVLQGALRLLVGETARDHVVPFGVDVPMSASLQVEKKARPSGTLSRLLKEKASMSSPLWPASDPSRMMAVLSHSESPPRVECAQLIWPHLGR